MTVKLQLGQLIVSSMTSDHRIWSSDVVTVRINALRHTAKQINRNQNYSAAPRTLVTTNSHCLLEHFNTQTSTYYVFLHNLWETNRCPSSLIVTLQWPYPRKHQCIVYIQTPYASPPLSPGPELVVGFSSTNATNSGNSSTDHCFHLYTRPQQRMRCIP